MSVTLKELKEIAVDLAEGKIFSNLHINEHNKIESVFMVLIFMDSEQRKVLSDNNVVFMYEYIEKANPLSVNGMPTFFSMRYLNKEDFAIMYVEYQKYVEMRTEFLEDYIPTLPINFGDSILTHEDLNKYKLNS